MKWTSFALMAGPARPLAFIKKEQPPYSKLGIYILKEFWLKEKIVPSISKFICIKSPEEVDKVMNRTFFL
jgi:hypothetical protein